MTDAKYMVHDVKTLQNTHGTGKQKIAGSTFLQNNSSLELIRYLTNITFRCISKLGSKKTVITLVVFHHLQKKK